MKTKMPEMERQLHSHTSTAMMAAVTAIVCLCIYHGNDLVTPQPQGGMLNLLARFDMTMGVFLLAYALISAIKFVGEMFEQIR